MYDQRPGRPLTPEKQAFARTLEEGSAGPSGRNLVDAVRHIRPTAIVGAAARAGAFSTEVIRALTKVTTVPLSWANSSVRAGA